MKCPVCRHESPETAKFCMECGQDLRSREKYSFRPRSYTPRFIIEKIFSGRNALEGERKQVTVLFADVADYTALAEKLDPEDVHEIMDGCFRLLTDAVHTYEGTINQFTGDGIMALFGAPLALEDHAVRACHAALSIQKSLMHYSGTIRKRIGRDFKMRIGLNTGTVIIGAIGDDLRMDYTAIGDAANLASRMESMADPGAILVSKSTQTVTRAFFEYKSMGAIPVKGKKKPQEAFRLLGPRKNPPRISSAATLGLSPFVGQNDAISSLNAAFARAKSGSGQVVDIIGEAGVGKSRLVMEFKNRLNPSEFICFEGGCLHYGGGTAYLPMRDILKGLFSIQDTDEESVIREKISCGICGLDAEKDFCLPTLLDFLSLKNDDPTYFQIGPEERKTRLMKIYGELMIRSGLRKPLILVIEDLHWTDQATEEFIRFFVPQIRNAKILLICIYRPPFDALWHVHPHCIRIRMLPLDMATGGLLIRSILADRKIAFDSESRILEKAGGNPLFIEELTWHLLEAGMVSNEGREGLSDLPVFEVPDTIENVIAARIDRLEPHSKKVLQIASVIGREFDPELLKSVSGKDAFSAGCLANLQENDFILEKQTSPVCQYAFKHFIVQDVAYNSLIQKKRKAIHEEIARFVELANPGRLQENCELLAHHYLKAGRTEKALDYLEMANQKAVRLSAGREALHSFTTLMGLMDKVEDQAAIQERRIRLIVDQQYTFIVNLKIYDYLDFLTRYESKVLDMNDPVILTKFYSALAVSHTYIGNYEQVFDAAGQAIRTGDAIGHPEYALEAYLSLFYSYFMKADYHDMHRVKRNIFRLLKKQFKLLVFGHILFSVSFAFADAGYCRKALRAARGALKLGGLYANNTINSLALIHIALAYCMRNEPTPAIRYADMAIQKIQTPMEREWIQNLHAYIMCRAGSFEKGIRRFQESRKRMQAICNRPAEIQALGFLGEACWLSGNYSEAVNALTEARELAGILQMKSHMSRAHYILGEIALQTGSPDASGHFEKSLELAKKMGAGAHQARAYSGLGRCCKRMGNAGSARNYLQKSLEIYNQLDILNEPDAVKKELADLPDAL